ncbi:hypothetical protein HG531_013028 [Fusarium graminearum]|nr:hypothetical protein HG531_013028 [Fusarium graminearum]
MAEASGDSDTDREGHMPSYNGEGIKNGLGSKVRSVDVRSADHEDLKGKPLSKVNGRAGNGKTNHGAPFTYRKGGAGIPTTPTTMGLFANQDNVEQKQRGT